MDFVPFKTLIKVGVVSYFYSLTRNAKTLIDNFSKI